MKCRAGAWLGALLVALALAGPVAAAPKFSAIAVDAHTGKILFAREADGMRHPASLTKVMTLYVLFQDLKAKRLKLDSRIRMSARAASMAPSKLGLRAGQTLSVDQAIRALVTKSANDVASAIAENLGGSESAFAARMTRVARSIGMGKSTFRNASGLPNPQQWTTARDMATLSLRIQRDFPEYYPYFSITSFKFNGRTVRGHNRLLGKYAGADGIKTGYIRASGFNLTSSARRGDKRVVGVVIGAKSGGSRNAYMMSMLDQAFPKCVSGKTVVASIGGTRVPAMQEAEAVAEAAPPAKPAVPPKPKAAPVIVQAGLASTSVAAEAGEDEAELMTAATQAGAIPAVKAHEPVALPFVVKSPEQIAAQGGLVLVPSLGQTWTIQIGAFPRMQDAEIKIQQAMQSGLKELDGKTHFTMEVESSGGTVYRARFAGFDKKGTEVACKRLARKGFACFAQQPQS